MERTRSLPDEQASPTRCVETKKARKKKYPKSTSYHGPLWPPLLRLVVQPSTSPPLVVRVILVVVASVSFLHLMYASAARFLRIKPVPANFLPQAAEPVHAARSHVPVHQPSVAEQLLARSDVPPNLRVEPYVNRKSKFWKVCMLRWH